MNNFLYEKGEPFFEPFSKVKRSNHWKQLKYNLNFLAASASSFLSFH